MIKISFQKVIGAVTVMCILMGLGAFGVNADIGDTTDQIAKDKIAKMEAEINSMEDKIMLEASIKLKEQKTDSVKRNKIQAEYKQKIDSESLKIQSNYGFKPVNSSDSLNTITPMSSSNSLTITDQLTYDSVQKLYRFQGDWDFTDGQWDMLKDIEDIAGVRMIKTSNYQIYSSYCKTWDNFGTQTGYVDQYGQHSPSNSYCTKKMEDAAGVAYNIIDEYNDLAGLIIYKTDKGRITQYIKKNAGAEANNKVFLDFNHNFKYYVWNFTATITSVNFNGINNAMGVTYGVVNGQWQRSSGGRTIN